MNRGSKGDADMHLILKSSAACNILIVVIRVKLGSVKAASAPWGCAGPNLG